MTTEPKAEGVEAVATYGMRRKGATEIIGIVPSKFHAFPARRKEYLADFEEVPLYTHPTPSAVEALARADVEYDAAHIEYLDALPDDYYTPQGQCYLADDHPAQVRWDAARQRRSAALAHPEIAALLRETK